MSQEATARDAAPSALAQVAREERELQKQHHEQQEQEHEQETQDCESQQQSETHNEVQSPHSGNDKAQTPRQLETQRVLAEATRAIQQQQDEDAETPEAAAMGKSSTSDILKSAAQDVLQRQTPEKDEALSNETTKANSVLQQVSADISSGDGEQDEENEEDQNNQQMSSSHRDRKSSVTKAWAKLYAEPMEMKQSSPRSRRQSRGSAHHGSSSRRFSLAESRERLSSTKTTRSSNKSGTPKRFIKEDDEKNCTFQPKINRSSRSMVRNSGPCLQRFETAHEVKEQALKTKRGKAEYEKRVDKKVCPQCHATQSYDEVKNRKNKCRDCKVAYRYKTVWQDVSENFLDRMESKMRESEEKRADLETKTAPSFRPEEKIVYDPTFGTTRRVKTRSLNWSEVSGEFMHRMETDMYKRDAKRVIAEQEALRDAGCTFRPKFETKEHSLATSGVYDLGVLGEDFTERMERDYNRRRREKAQNMVRARYQSTLLDPALGFKTRAAWDDPLANSFQGGQRRNTTGRWM